MQKIRNGSFAKYLVTLEAHENDLLLFNGDQFIWAFDAEIDDDTKKLMWAAACYFDDYRIVPPLAEIKKYYNNPFCIREGLCFAIDQENNRAVLQGSNFHDDERPINSPISPVVLVEYQGISYPVTAVADWGFYNNTSVTDLILPDSITQIGNYAFANSIIHEVKMPADISVGKNVFYGCNHLSEKMKNYQDGIKIDQHPQCNVLRKGDIFQTNASDQTVVLDVNGNDALLFNGRQFIQATNIRQQEHGLQWDESQVYEQFCDISKQQPEQSCEDEWEPEM
ncbi:leucine-rich repeat protein [Acetobacterium carbinolicum]|uniref:leucine-rich repeat protein n=1 Tax=Acetobacterium carbinolicum TaxID=52690 RepID=UPI0039C9BAD1